MKSGSCLKTVLLFSALVICASPVWAQIDADGNGSSRAVTASTASTASIGDCSILYYNDEEDNISRDLSRFVGLGFAMTECQDPLQMTLDYLKDFNVLILYSVAPNKLADQAPAIFQFVSAGGSLYIHQPSEAGNVVYSPPGLEIEIINRFWCNGPEFQDYNPCIVDWSHHLTAGFTDLDIGGDFDKVGNLGPGFTLLAWNCVCEDPALAVGQYGAGRVVFDTNNFIGVLDTSDAYIINLTEYLCEGQALVKAENVSWGELKALYR